MDEARKLEIGERIRRLREESPYKQQAVADKLGIGLRAYQKLEEVGTTRWERCEELAEIFEVDPYWIWTGHEKGAAPDIMGTLNGDDRLGRIEKKLDDVLARLDLFEARLHAASLGQQSFGEREQSREGVREARGH